MSSINANTTLTELATVVSEALEAAGIRATLAGGAAVSLYSENAYQSADLDFVTTARQKAVAEAIRPLGFESLGTGSRQFEHPSARWYLEFPPGPLGFGDTNVGDDAAQVITTEYGGLRIVTPTQIVMDRLAAYAHWHDNQSLDQARLVVRHQRIDWDGLSKWGRREGIEPRVIADLKAEADTGDSSHP